VGGPTPECPEEDRSVDLLVEWKIETGEKVLHSVCCNHSGLTDYSGKKFRWGRIQKLSGRRK